VIIKGGHHHQDGKPDQKPVDLFHENPRAALTPDGIGGTVEIQNAYDGYEKQEEEKDPVEILKQPSIKHHSDILQEAALLVDPVLDRAGSPSRAVLAP